MFHAGALKLAAAEKEDLLQHAGDLESQITALKEELQTVKSRQEEESQEAAKREDALAVQANSLATSIASKYLCATSLHDAFVLLLTRPSYYAGALGLSVHVSGRTRG